MTRTKNMLLIDCDGTCYPWDQNFNGQFKQALRQTAENLGMSPEYYQQKSLEVRGKYPGMMNFILALCEGDRGRFDAFVQQWCQQLNYQLIQPNQDLGNQLQNSRDSVCILTNNCREHLRRVWERLFPERQPDVKSLTIEDTYDGKWFHPKQDPGGFTRICQTLGRRPEEVVMLDDSALILGVAMKAGLGVRRVTAQKNLAGHLKELVRE